MVAGGLVLVGTAAPLRESLIALEPTIPPLLVTAALGWVSWLALARASGDRLRARALRRGEQRLGRWLARWGWGPAVLLWLLPLWSHWAGRPPDRHAAWLAPLGQIPWSDANGYFEGALQLLSEGHFGHFAEQKPIFPALFAVALALTRGRLEPAQMAQAIALGLASFMAARQVGLRYGPWCAIGFFGFLLGLGRSVIPAVVTEPLGWVFGCLALAVLASARARRQVSLFGAGMLLLAVALQVRPGAQLVLPALALWAAGHFRGRRERALVWAVAAVIVANLFTTVLNRCYGARESSFYARPALLLYGLARGSNQEQAAKDFGQEFATEEHFATFVYGKAFAEVRSHPLVLLRSCAAGMARLVEKGIKTSAHVVNVRHVVQPYRGSVRTTSPAWPGELLLALLCALALARAWPSRERALWLAVAAGTLASGMFVGIDTGFHGVAAVQPLIALGLSLGLVAGPIPRRVPASGALEAHERDTLRASLVSGVVLLLVTLVGPAWARRVWPKPTATMLLGMQPGRDMIIAREASPTVVVGPDGLSFRLYNELLDFSGTKMGGMQPPPPFAVLSAWDFVARRQRVVYAPVELGGVDGFVHLVIDEEQRAPNLQFVDRARAWNRLGPWR